MKRRAVCLAFLACAFVGTAATPSKGPLTIYIVNESPLTDQQIEAALPAWQASLSEDFAPVWGVDARLVLTEKPPVDGWRITLQQWPRDPSCGLCAGLHSIRGGVPWAQVGTADGDWSQTLTHELFEMLADPGIRGNGDHARLLKDKTGRRWLVEVCDPVAWGSYERAGAAGTRVEIADFVTPGWYTGAAGTQDFLAAVGAHQLGFGGYAFYRDRAGIHPWRDNGGWG